MSHQPSKSNEEIAEEFNDRSNDRMFLENECKNSFWFEEGEEIRYDQDKAGKWLLEQLKAKDAEREKAVEEEAYLWFDTWYAHTISPKKDGFGKWATERLQTLGVKII